MRNKNAYIIAGPNGAGKTTFAKKFLPKYVKCPNFVNADLIAHGLSPFSPRLAALKAGKLVLKQIHEFANKNADFSFETTLAGKSYKLFLQTLKNNDYSIHLFYLWIPNTEMALRRIKERVADGGHDVPEQDVKRRFYRGLCNLFEIYRSLLDTWMLFDNSGITPILIAEERKDGLSVINKILFEKVLKNAKIKL